MPNVRWLLALVTASHRFLYRATRGFIGSRALGMRALLLTTTGRRTGREHCVPLLYVEDDGRYVVVASNAGDERSPAWWLNLRASGTAAIQVGSERLDVRAREATPEESDRLWPMLIASYRYYAGYRHRTRRAIPVVILERT